MLELSGRKYWFQPRTALTAAAMLLLACGPADESVQREIGNLPPAHDAEPTNTPEPTPVPTVCIQFEKPDGSVGDICITPSPPSTPTKYGQNLKEKLLEAEQQSGGAGRTTRSSDEEPTDVPTPNPTEEPCPHTPGEYSNLDKTLASLVERFETCESTEAEAAAEAPFHEGTRVLVSINLVGDDDTALYDWMGSNNYLPRYQVTDTSPDFIYSWVKISRLGALAQRSELTGIEATENLFNAEKGDDNWGNPGELTAAAMDETGEPLPVFPWFLKGYEHPGRFSQVKGKLNWVLQEYRAGTLTDAYREEDYIACNFVEGTNSLRLSITTNAEAADDLETWLSSNGGTNIRVNPETFGGTGFMSVTLPLDNLLDLVDHPGLQEVRALECYRSSYQRRLNQEAETYAVVDTPQNVPANYRTASQIHLSKAWSDSRTRRNGTGIKVAIIDSSGIGDFSTRILESERRTKW